MLKQNNWSLLPVLPRLEFITKEIRRLLRGGARKIEFRVAA